MTDDELRVEATGETVGEAKWQALRQLETLAADLDRAAVRFQVVSEGERGLLGVGYSPARVIATAPRRLVRAAPAPVAAQAAASEAAELARDLVQRVTAALGLRCAVEVSESDESVVVSCSGGDLGLLIGRHGQTIDAVQYLANAIVFRSTGDRAKEVVVDAAGYRARREAALHALALDAAERALSAGDRVQLEPMTAVERKVVHLRLKEYAGIETASEGTEPNRHVVVFPASG